MLRFDGLPGVPPVACALSKAAGRYSLSLVIYSFTSVAYSAVRNVGLQTPRAFSEGELVTQTSPLPSKGMGLLVVLVTCKRYYRWKR